MKTPNGEQAQGIDSTMLLSMWVKHLDEQLPDAKKDKSEEMYISAGMGRPNFPLSEHFAKAGRDYWADRADLAAKERKELFGVSTPAKETSAPKKDHNFKSPIRYDDPQGNKEARTKMAAALSRWYEPIEIKPEHILFTVGGAGALRATFNMLERESTKGRILTPFPHYGLYSSSKLTLHPIHVMKEKGYLLNAKALEKSLAEAEELAKIDKKPVRAILLCEPNNPLGTITPPKELKKIAVVLRKAFKKNPKLLIILDEAYAEMRLDGQHFTSLLEIAPDLKNNIILNRSATKAHSAAGERAAVTVSSNPEIMTKLLRENIDNYGHAPVSIQVAYAEAMDKLDNKELQNYASLYKPKIEYVTKRLAEMGASMPDPAYKVTGTFYTLADFSDILNLDLPESTYPALGEKGKITTDIDITYSLLFEDKVMIAPLSFFGLSPKSGYMRITCSGGDNELEILMNRVESRLLEARKIKQARLLEELTPYLSGLAEKDAKESKRLAAKRDKTIEYQKDPKAITALSLKTSNTILADILLETQKARLQNPSPEENKAASKIQHSFRMFKTRRDDRLAKEEKTDRQWEAFVEKLIPDSPKLDGKLQPSPPKDYLLALSPRFRGFFLGWSDGKAHTAPQPEKGEATHASESGLPTSPPKEISTRPT